MIAGQSYHSTYADTSMFTGQAGQAVHATYADTASFAGLANFAVYADTALASSVSLSSTTADTSYFAVGYTPTDQLGAVALSNDFADLFGVPNFLTTDAVTITEEQAAAIEANTAKVGITTDQAAAIEANTAKVSGATSINGLSDGLVRISIGLDNDIVRTYDLMRESMKKVGIL